MRRPAPIGILLCLGLSIPLMLAGRPEFGGRIDAPALSGGDGTLAPEQIPVSPPAVVASAAETAAVAAAASAETAPLADPAAAPGHLVRRNRLGGHTLPLGFGSLAATFPAPIPGKFTDILSIA